MSSEPIYKRVLLKASGEALMGAQGFGIDVTIADQIASDVKQAVEMGVQVAIVLNGAKIGKNSLVGAGALVTENKEFPDNSLIVGAPAKAIRVLDDQAVAGLRESATHYVALSLIHI